MKNASKQVILSKECIHSIIINIRYLLDMVIIINIYIESYKEKILLNYTYY